MYIETTLNRLIGYVHMCVHVLVSVFMYVTIIIKEGNLKGSGGTHRKSWGRKRKYNGGNYILAVLTYKILKN